MTIDEAYALKTGDVIARIPTEDRFPGRGVVTIRKTPANPVLGFPPSISGPDADFPNVRLFIILDGGRECMTALRYWRKA
jgi:hypothetical protein